MAKAKKLPSGNWRAQVYLGRDANNKRIVRSVTASTKKEAELRAAQIQMTVPGDRMTLRQAFNKYVTARANVLSDTTYREYSRIARNSTRRIMDMDIDSIRQEDVEQFVNEMAASMKPKTVRNYYGVFTTVMKTYRPNVHFTIKLPQREKKRVYIPEPETVRRLHSLLADHWLLVPFLLASQCGLRASEIAGLQYKHIKKDRILIRQARVRGINGAVVKKPKTEAGDRDVPVGEYILSQIGTGSPNDFVVPQTATWISNAWRKFMAKQDEEYFSFHKLRHFFASRALLMGIPKKYVIDMMGHSSARMIDQVYEHIFSSEQDSFMGRLAAENDAFLRESSHDIPHDLSETLIK